MRSAIVFFENTNYIHFARSLCLLMQFVVSLSHSKGHLYSSSRRLSLSFFLTLLMQAHVKKKTNVTTEPNTSNYLVSQVQAKQLEMAVSTIQKHLLSQVQANTIFVDHSSATEKYLTNYFRCAVEQKIESGTPCGPHFYSGVLRVFLKFFVLNLSSLYETSFAYFLVKLHICKICGQHIVVRVCNLRPKCFCQC